MASKVLLYDTTLRDGMQGEGMSLTAGEKVRVAHALDGLGIHFVEAGFPSSNPKEEALFDLLSRETFEHAEIAAFGMTRRKDAAAADDEGLRVLASCFAPVCTLVMSSHALYTALDGDRIASQSEPVLGDLLRGDLGFRGVVVTDSIEAQAVLERSGVAEAAERSVEAGSDLVLMTGSGSWNRVQPRLLRRARRDPGFRAKVRAAAARVIRLKRTLGLASP